MFWLAVQADVRMLKGSAMPGLIKVEIEHGILSAQFSTISLQPTETTAMFSAYRS